MYNFRNSIQLHSLQSYSAVISKLLAKHLFASELNSSVSTAWERRILNM